MQGTRVYPNVQGFLDPQAMAQPGAYGRCTAETVRNHPEQGYWQVRAPDGKSCSLSPMIHTVTEHDDGTITVHPSIDMSGLPWRGFHGWLTRGIWRSA